jgi:hypothetical protein
MGRCRMSHEPVSGERQWRVAVIVPGLSRGTVPGVEV